MNWDEWLDLRHAYEERRRSDWMDEPDDDYEEEDSDVYPIFKAIMEVI